tara:strand:- start:98 stop:592 length:495 start_codon:yes stop_codon:yes gene_type:complete
MCVFCLKTTLSRCRTPNTEENKMSCTLKTDTLVGGFFGIGAVAAPSESNIEEYVQCVTAHASREAEAEKASATAAAHMNCVENLKPDQKQEYAPEPDPNDPDAPNLPKADVYAQMLPDGSSLCTFVPRRHDFGGVGHTFVACPAGLVRDRAMGCVVAPPPEEPM